MAGRGPVGPLARAQTASSDPRITRLIGQVSDARIAEILKKLGSFETRNTLSSTDSPTTGIGAARQWILDEMKKSSARLQVSFDAYQAPKEGRITREVELRNVMAVLPGKSARRVYISAHYDTFARRPPARRQGGPRLPPVRSRPQAPHRHRRRQRPEVRPPTTTRHPASMTMGAGRRS